MVSRKTFITILSVAAIGVASVCTIESAKGGVLRNAAADDVSYTLTLDNTATFASNAATINTTEGNPIVFTSSSGSLALTANATLVNTTKISGIASVQVTFASGAVSFTYDWNSAISRAFDGGSLSASGTVTFNNDKPSYFKMTATADTTITSLIVTYTCLDTENKTVHISDYAGLKAIGDHLDYNYVLDNDIDCGGKGFWVDGTYAMVIDTFTGKLDGQGHVVSNLWLDGGWNNGFMKILQGTVQNIAFKNMYSGLSPYSWGFFGTVNSSAVINNVYLDLALTSDGGSGSWEFQGGLVGIADACKISNCVVNLRTNTSTVTSYPYTASLVGHAASWNTSLKNCYAIINGLTLCANGTYYQEAATGVAAAGMVNCANYTNYAALKAAADVSTFSSTYWTFGASSLTFGSTVVI
jgi:hypothetical protein